MPTQCAAINAVETAERLKASIEMMGKQILETTDLTQILPAGTHVYIPDIGSELRQYLIPAAKRLTEQGFVPVPHIAARRLGTRGEFESLVSALAGEAAVSDVLVIGGGLDRPTGDFDSAMAVIETGLFDKYGVRRIGVAGHPEGSPDFSEQTAYEALILKQQFAERSDAQLRIVTQFAFDPVRVAVWIDSLAAYGISLPIHVGVAGPCKLTTLLKYAAMCGVGNSMSMLRRNTRSIASITMGHSPEPFVEEMERKLCESGNIERLHVFVFGGIGKASEWLKWRGSWAN